MTTAKKASGAASQTTTTSLKGSQKAGTQTGSTTENPNGSSPGTADAAPQMMLADAPALAMGMIYMAAAQSQTLLFENAVHTQALTAAAAQTANLQGIAQLEKITAASSQAALEKLAAANLVDQILAKKAAAAG